MEYRSDVAEDKKKEAAIARKEEKTTSGTSSSSTVNQTTVSSSETKTTTKTSTKPSADTKIASSSSQPAKETKKSNGGGNKLTFPERKEMNKLEKEIEKIGGQIQEYEDKLAKCKEGYTVLAELTNEMNKLVLLLGKQTVCVVFCNII